MLTLNSVTVRLGGHTVLDHASASLPAKSRVGLVGRNGAGKSTLLKVIAGMAEADDGAIEMPRDTRIGYLAQEAPGGAATPFEIVLAADEERGRLLAAADHASDPLELGDIHERLNAIDAYGAPARAARILAGLGFDEAAQHQPLDSFSGGWRMRAALAAILFADADLMLLDEPSNHLDLEAAIWLESFLNDYRGTLLVVSHERDLLNNVADHILHLDGGKTTLYVGGYDAFERQRRERQERAEVMRAKQEAKRQKLQAYIDRWRYKAHTARQAQSRMKALAKMAPILAVNEDASLVFDFPNPDDLRPPLISLDAAAVGYVEGNPVLSHLDLRIDPDDRIALLGRNGNGKTTLARLLAGELAPMRGRVTASGKLRVGYFAQHQVEELVAEETPLLHMARVLPLAKPLQLRSQLARFGFSGDKAEVQVKNLSGGERARLALALITRDAPHLIILDEPTNHLDIDARDTLIEALAEFSGAVIVVSHDRHVVELSADRLVLVAEGSAADYAGSLEDYRALVLSEGRGADEAEKRPTRRDARRSAAQAREKVQPLRAAVKRADAEVTRLAARRRDIEATLLDPKSYGNGAKPTVAELMKEKSRIDADLAEAEARWLEASEALERAEARS